VEHTINHGDVFVVPSWVKFEMRAEDGLDLFRFTDAPIFEVLHQYRQLTGQGGAA
jgi:gentisate 1,2-dioxygenase